MRDSLQQGVQALAMLQTGVTREIAILCAAVLLYVMAALWLVIVIRQRPVLAACLIRAVRGADQATRR